MHVKLDKYNWGIQNCRLRRRHFREWEVVERVELKIDGIYQVDSLHHRKCLIFSRQVHQEVRGTKDLFLVTLQSAVLYARSVFSVTLHLAELTLLIAAEESIQIATAPYLVLFQLRSVLMPCRPNYTASH